MSDMDVNIGIRERKMVHGVKEKEVDYGCIAIILGLAVVLVLIL